MLAGMNRFLKYGLLAFAGLAVLLPIFFALVAATLDPNDFKPQFAALVEAKSHRTLTVPGNIKLAFFPRFAMDIGRATLSEYGSPAEFASIEGARLDLAWLPLLRGELSAGKIRVDGLRVRLVRRRDGSTNFDDLLRPGQTRFEIAGLRATGAAVFSDEAAGRQLAVTDLKLETGPLGGGRAGDASAHFNLRSDEPALDIRIDANGRLALDNRAGRLTWQGLTMTARGEAGGLSGLVLTATGNIESERRAKHWLLQDIGITVAGRRGDAAFGADLHIPQLADRGDALHADVLAAGLEWRQGKSVFRAKLDGRLDLDLEKGRIVLPQLAASMNFRPSGSRSGGSAQLSGTALLDLGDKSAHLDMAGRLDGGRIKIGLAASGAGMPRYAFDMDAERLDLDRYLPLAPSAAARHQADFSWLKRFDVWGRLHVGELKMTGAISRNVTFEIAPLASGK